MTSARGDHVEAGGARPVDEIANQRRLVAIGQAVDHARFRGAARQQRSAHRVRFHGDHHYMLAMLECGQRVFDRGDRIARGFDDDVDQRMRNERLPVVTHMREAGGKRSVQRCGGMALRIPADSLQVDFRVCRRQIRDAGKMQAGGLGHLRQIHGAEFSGADQADAQRLALRFALAKFGVEIHSSVP